MTATPSRLDHCATPKPISKLLAFVRGHRLVLAAAGISAALHALAFFGTPSFLRDFSAPKIVTYQAKLIDASPKVNGADSLPLAIPVVPPAPAAPRVKRLPKISSPPTPPKSEANFVAPENAIAVAPVEAVETVGAAPPQSVSANGLIPYPEPDPYVVPQPSAEATAPQVTATEALPRQKPAPPAESESEAEPELPSRFSIDYRITSSLTNGNATFKWQRTDKRYEIESTIQASGFLAEMFVGAFKQVSRGRIAPGGLRPEYFSMQRGEGEADVADFEYPLKELRLKMRNGQARVVPLPAKLQDMQSFLFQLAHDAPNLKSPDDVLTVNVTNARKIYRYQFRALGEEIVETSTGPVKAIHLKSAATNPEDTYEVWLSPTHHYLPVKLKFQIGRFPVEQIATSMGAK